MNLDDLKSKLAEQDAKLDQLVRLNTTAVRELQFTKTKSSLAWLTRGIVFELLMAIVAVVWLGNFIAGHLQEPQFLLPAVLVDICVIAYIGACVRQLVAISSLNYGLPVVTVQKELSKLRVLRIRTTKWVMILSFALWFPVLVVLLEGLLSVNMWLIMGAIRDQAASFFNWIVANVIFGLAVALVIILVSKRYADRVESSPAIKRLMDDFAGRSLTKALTSLEAIVRFEAEPSGR